MTAAVEEAVAGYVAEIDAAYRSGRATEHTYRPALERLLNAVLPAGMSALNEPKRCECGAPDFIIAGRGGRAVAFVEAKDVGDADLDGKRRTGHKEQFDRYKASLDAIAFTDYLDFRLWLNGEKAGEARIAEEADGRIVAASGDAPCKFAALVDALANAEPRKVASAPQLAKMMAGKARLLQQAALKFLGRAVSTKPPQAGGSRFIATAGAGEKCCQCENVANGQQPIANAGGSLSASQMQPLCMSSATANAGNIGNWKLGNGNIGNNGNIPSCARIFYADAWGRRKEKFAFLESTAFGGVKWREVAPSAPMYFFVPKDVRGEERYMRGFSVADLFPVNSMGVTTGDDATLVDDDAQSLLEKVARRHGSANAEKIRRVAYRPFDERLLYYDAKLLARAREKFVEAMVGRVALNAPRFAPDGGLRTSRPTNVALCCIRISSRDDDLPVFVTDKITDKTLLSSKDNASVLPLYLYREDMGVVRREANLDAGIVGRIAEILRESEANERALAYYNRFELGRTWYDAAPREALLALEPIPVEPDPTADRRKVKDIFRRMPPVRNARDGRVVTFPVNIAKKFTIHRDFNVLTVAHALGGLFASSMRAWSEYFAEIPNHKEHREITGYHQYVGKLLVKGVSFYVRFTVRENPHVNERNEIHESVVTKIESYKAESAELPNPGHARAEGSTPLYARIVAFPDGGVNGGFSEKASDAEMSLRTHTHGEGSASSNARIVAFPGGGVNGANEGENEGAEVTLLRRTQGVASAPFIDHKIALFLSFVNGDSSRGASCSREARDSRNSRSSSCSRDSRDSRLSSASSPSSASNVSPEEIFDYVYGVLHTPEYRREFREFLKTDFPRVPYPSGAAQFRAVAALGRELRETHLMLDAPPPLSEKTASFPVMGDNVVEGLRVESRRNLLRVWINGSQHFDNVPAGAFNHEIGGYRPAQKWLKDRKGRALSAADVLHWRRIVLALAKTRRIERELSALAVAGKRRAGTRGLPAAAVATSATLPAPPETQT